MLFVSLASVSGAFRVLRSKDRAAPENSSRGRRIGRRPVRDRRAGPSTLADGWRQPTTRTTAREHDLLEAARAGDEDAYGALLAPYRGELHAHCYRMLGSVHDAEDALQEACCARGAGSARFEGRSSLRSWLYTIATNTCLNPIARRPKRVLPIDYGPSTDPHDGLGEPLAETVWVEPYPDETLGVEDGLAAPEARYEQRESVELAFVAALQHLPATQRAVLILREVLGFSAAEVAETLETTRRVGQQRAAAGAQDGRRASCPERSQQATLRALGDEQLRELVDALHGRACSAATSTRSSSMLAEDAAWSMPPLPTLVRRPRGDHAASSRSARCRARGAGATARRARTARPRSAPTRWDEEEGAYLPFALDVLTLEGDRIKEVTAFITRTAEGTEQDYYAHWPEPAARPRAVRLRAVRAPGPARLSVMKEGLPRWHAPAC